VDSGQWTVKSVDERVKIRPLSKANYSAKKMINSQFLMARIVRIPLKIKN
jgi:hypothetical protein